MKDIHVDIHLMDSPQQTNVKVREMLQKILGEKE